MSFIENTLYEKIIKNVPILCIDLIINYEKNFLLVKRKENPMSGEWWVPGGRVKIGEDIKEAAVRKLNQELSIYNHGDLKKYALYQDFFKSSSIGTHLYHTLSIVFKVKIDNLSAIDIDKTSSEWALKNNLPKRLKNKMEIINE
jgi:colanic acid biosynthesis protein WcaH